MLGEINMKGNNLDLQNLTLQALINENNEASNIKLEEMSEINVIDLPGNLQLVPTRPIFLNIYETEITYPSLEGKVKQNAGGWSWWKKVFK